MSLGEQKPGRHSVTVSREQATCCDNPAHTQRIARCSCGWESQRAWEMKDALDAVTGHRIATLEAAAGIKFSVRATG